MLCYPRMDHARAIAAALAQRGLPLTALVVIKGPSQLKNLRRTWRAAGTLGILRGVANRLLLRHGRPIQSVIETDPGGAAAAAAGHRSPAVLRGDRTNGPATLAILRDLAPDLLLLGGCGILQPAILRIPRLGVLNAHPGWLPDYRGLSVVAWALLNGDPPGASVHWVDGGIDTGDIVLRRRLPSRHFTSIDEATQAATNLCGTLMAEAVENIANGRATRTVQPRAGAAWPRMPRTIQRELDSALRRGTPMAGVAS